ncbi:MAG: hypothetical protein PHU71_03335 [Candidatus Gracilibacteria bacterium]|nr:hypothetical protein [Candidatus Gracilibacteria bacterium]
MPQNNLLRRRIDIACAVKLELSHALRQGKLEFEKASEISTEIADRLKKAENFENLNLEFSKIIKDFKLLNRLSLRLEEFKKHDLDIEISDLVEDLIQKASFDKAISLGSQVISVYVRNPDINLDDFRLELLKKEYALTTKKSTKMHKTVEQRTKNKPTNPEPGPQTVMKRIVHTGPVEEGQILQEGEVFSAPGQEDFHDPAEDIKTPEIDAAKLAENQENLKKNVKNFVSLFKTAAKEVTGETGRKLKDKTIEVLAKAQEKKGAKQG